MSRDARETSHEDTRFDGSQIEPSSLQKRNMTLTAYLFAESGDPTPLHKGTVRVGRDAATEVSFSEDLLLSSFHYEIVSSGEGHMIYKLDAAADLHLNGKLITEALLKDGDIITAGATTLIYCRQVPDSPEDTKEPMQSHAVVAEVSPDDLRPSRVLAAFVAMVSCIFAYSFVYNLSWLPFAISLCVIGHGAGWLVKMIGNERDLHLGLIAALAALAGVLIVHLLSLTGTLQMVELISLPNAAISTSPELTEAEKPMTQVGTGKTAAEVTQLSLDDVWRRFIPGEPRSKGRFQVVEIHGFTAHFLRPKSLLAYGIIMIMAARRASRRSLKVAKLDAQSLST
jgi:hypothetical protein